MTDDSQQKHKHRKKIYCNFLQIIFIATVSSIGPDELPPPFQQEMSGGVPMVTCRVCQAMIDITWKREQHVVKCTQCNEATVRQFYYKTFLLVI